MLRRSLNGEVVQSPDRIESFRINRYLATAGYGSRRDTERFVTEGRVELNGIRVTTLDTKVKPGDLVTLDGQIVNLPENALYYVMNKPIGFEVTKESFDGSPTIYDLLPENLQSLKYAGRLDKNSRGVLLLSNDGDFINQITHPSTRILKRYIVTLDDMPDENEMRRSFIKGISDGDDLLRAVSVRVLDRDTFKIEVVLGQGKNRQIRRMVDYLGLEVLDLYRAAVGHFDLEKTPLEEGKIISFKPAYVLYGKKSVSREDALQGFNPWKK